MGSGELSKAPADGQVINGRFFLAEARNSIRTFFKPLLLLTTLAKLSDGSAESRQRVRDRPA